MRFVREIAAVTLLMIVVSSATLLYVGLPYEMGLRLVLRVSVTESFGDSYLYNVTLSTTRSATPDACENASWHIQRLRSWGMKDPNSALQMGMNLTLSQNGMPIEECKARISFSKEGEYTVVVLAGMTGLHRQTYALTVSYGSGFNATRTIRESSWNATITLY